MLLHGDDFVACGGDAALDWLATELQKVILLKVVARLGGDAGDAKEARCLNRVLRWTDRGICLEADPRHAELLAAMLGPGATSLLTPGVKAKVGQGRLELVRKQSVEEVLNSTEYIENTKLIRQLRADLEAAEGRERERRIRREKRTREEKKEKRERKGGGEER